MSDLFADAAKAKHAESAISQLSTERTLPLPAQESFVFRDQIARARQHEQYRELRRRRAAATALRHRDSARGTRVRVDVIAALSDRCDQLQLRQSRKQLRAHASAFANKHDRVCTFEPSDERILSLHAVVEHRHLMLAHLRETFERANAILIVIENHEAHGRALYPMHARACYNSRMIHFTRRAAIALLISSTACLQTLAIAAPQAATAPAVSASAPWPKGEAALNTLGETLMNSVFAKVTAKDSAGFEKLTQAGLLTLNFQGSEDRAGALASIATDTSKSVKVSDVISARIGEALVVTCLVAADETINGVHLPHDATPRLGVWQWSDGAWRLAALASLNMPAARPAPSAPTFAGDSAVNADGQALVTKFLMAQFKKDEATFDAMLAEGMQSANFKGQKGRADLIKGADYAKSDVAPVITDVRASRCGDLTVVTCTLAMGQKIGFSTLPADPAPFMIVFQGAAANAKAIATANTNKPK